ncbi:hypothetical protein [Terricaulis sp.]|uniref:hypothetical protein n=1 Tax=Terricaulis sp. TaxID=2768686 RepID=UPI003784CAE0
MKNGLIATLLGGLVAGTLDILYAFIVYGPLSFGISPQQVLQSVAGGWIGREATRSGGWNTALLGLATHFMLATIMAGVFVLIASQFRALKKNAVLWGFIYGLILYVAMNYVVVPLSHAGDAPGFASSLEDASARLQESFSKVRGGGGADYPWLVWGTVFTHTVLVGIPIALINKRFTAQQA